MAVRCNHDFSRLITGRYTLYLVQTAPVKVCSRCGMSKPMADYLEMDKFGKRQSRNGAADTSNAKPSR